MLFFYDKTSINQINIEYPDIYFTPEYGKICEFSDDGIWELCVFKDLLYVYIKKKFIFNDIVYFDLISPYGYSGYYYKNYDTLKEFIPLFRKIAKEKNYLTEVIRQNPYIGNINLKNYYDIILSKNIYAIKYDDYNKYYYETLNSKTRNIIKKAYKNKYSFKFFKLEKNILEENFTKMYHNTMAHVNSLKYYYFNNDYFNELENNPFSYLIIIYDTTNKKIGCAIFFIFKNFIHYHLSCNDRSSNCITNYLLDIIIKEYGNSKLIILGGGLSNKDELSNFKKKISTHEYEYTMYKNIINNEIYEKIKLNYADDLFFPIHRK